MRGAILSLFFLLTLLGCGAQDTPGEARAELGEVRTSYSNVDNCEEGGARCFDRLDLAVMITNAGGRPLEVRAERFTLTAANGQSFVPQAYARPCAAALRPGLRLSCTLVFTLEPVVPDASLFPAELSFPGAGSALLEP